MSTPEQNHSSERSLSPEASQRVILLLKGVGEHPQPLSKEGAAHLETTLHKNKSKLEQARSKVASPAGKYLLEFTVTSNNTTEAIYDAVMEADTALLKDMIPAEVEEAWLVTPGKPDFEHLRFDDFDQMTNVTDEAKSALDEHRHATLEQDFDRLLFVA